MFVSTQKIFPGFSNLFLSCCKLLLIMIIILFIFQSLDVKLWLFILFHAFVSSFWLRDFIYLKSKPWSDIPPLPCSFDLFLCKPFLLFLWQYVLKCTTGMVRGNPLFDAVSFSFFESMGDFKRLHIQCRSNNGPAEYDNILWLLHVRQVLEHTRPIHAKSPHIYYNATAFHTPPAEFLMQTITVCGPHYCKHEFPSHCDFISSTLIIMVLYQLKAVNVLLKELLMTEEKKKKAKKRVLDT